MAAAQPMEIDYPNEVAILNASKALLLNEQFNCRGISVDLYQFSDDPTTPWKKGHIFHANDIHGLSFGDKIETSEVNNKREAVFIVHEANKQDDVEDMMMKSLKLKHVGIRKPIVVGFNTQISRVVSAFRVPTLTLEAWLDVQKEKALSNYIPIEVQELIRIAYMAIEKIWEEGSTSETLAHACSYQMIDNRVQIDPLCLCDKNGDKKYMDLRTDFGKMIKEYIYSRWEDVELADFIELLNNSNARVKDILGAPVLLLPSRRELMYGTLDKDTVDNSQENFLENNAKPADDWKRKASNLDPALKRIIDGQPIGFSADFKGAFHFARVVAAHYEQNFRKTGQSNVDMKGRVDLLLKQVLPGLLSKRYNCKYI